MLIRSLPTQMVHQEHVKLFLLKSFSQLNRFFPIKFYLSIHNHLVYQTQGHLTSNVV